MWETFYPLRLKRLLTKAYITLQPGWNLLVVDVRLSEVCTSIWGDAESHNPFCGWEETREMIQSWCETPDPYEIRRKGFRVLYFRCTAI